MLGKESKGDHGIKCEVNGLLHGKSLFNILISSVRVPDNHICVVGIPLQRENRTRQINSLLTPSILAVTEVMGDKNSKTLMCVELKGLPSSFYLAQV